MDAKWKVRSVILGAALGAAVLGAPAAAGEGLRVVEVPGEHDCAVVRVMDGDTVVWERSLFTHSVDEQDPEWPIGWCGDLGEVVPYRMGIYFFIAQRSQEGRLYRWWWHSNGTLQGTTPLYYEDPDQYYPDFVPQPAVVYRGRLVGPMVGGTASGRELWIAGPGHPTRLIKDIRPGPKGSAIRKLQVKNGLLRFRANDGKGWRWWVSDGTRKGTHVVKR